MEAEKNYRIDYTIILKCTNEVLIRIVADNIYIARQFRFLFYQDKNSTIHAMQIKIYILKHSIYSYNFRNSKNI